MSGVLQDNVVRLLFLIATREKSQNHLSVQPLGLPVYISDMLLLVILLENLVHGILLPCKCFIVTKLIGI